MTVENCIFHRPFWKVNKTTGQLSIGTHTGNLEDMAVYSGGSSEVLSRLIGAKGRDVLYVGDHIFGDVIKSKKLRGWRTFLIVPELNDEVNINNCEMKQILLILTIAECLDQQAATVYEPPEV